MSKGEYRVVQLNALWRQTKSRLTISHRVSAVSGFLHSDNKNHGSEIMISRNNMILHFRHVRGNALLSNFRCAEKEITAARLYNTLLTMSIQFPLSFTEMEVARVRISSHRENNRRNVTSNLFAKDGTTSHDCKRMHKKWQSANSGGARGRDFYFISRARSFGATATRSRSLFPFLAGLLATFKSASRRGCSPSSFSVLRLSWRVPAHRASFRPPQTLILFPSPFPYLFSSLVLSPFLFLPFFLFSIFFFTLNLPCGGRARVVALINF